MNELLTKSELSMEAAEKLQKERFYNAACHPMYYSCLQLVMHKLESEGISLEEQAALASSKYHGHTHECLMYESAERVKLREHRNKRDYLDNFKILKEMRVRADYRREMIGESDFLSGMEIAKLVTKEIKSI